MKKIIALIMAVAVIASMGLVSSVAEESAVPEPVWFWELSEVPCFTGAAGKPVEEHDGYVSFEDVTGDGMLFPTTEENYGVGLVVDPSLGPVDCYRGKIVVVKMRVTLALDISAVKLQVYNYGYGANGQLGHGFTDVDLEDNKDWQYAIADMTGIDYWDNASNTSVSWFRIDPVNQNGASADVAWVALFETVEDAQAYIEADKSAPEATEAPTEEPTEEPTDEPASTEEPTEAPENTAEATKAPVAEATDAPAEEEGGCGSLIGGVSSVAIAMAAAVLFLKKRR